MCGRFSLSVSAELLEAAFEVPGVPAGEPRYNIAPSQPVLVLRRPTPDSMPRWDRLSWGLLPAWAKDPRAPRPINARAETAAEKPTFRSALKSRRCLIPADAFFEWRQAGKHKQPMCLRRRDHAPFAFAGLWEHWAGPGADPVTSCVILTTAPNALVAPIHDRMPVIVRPADFARWLDPGEQDPGRLLPVCAPYPEGELEAYAVDPRVGSPTFDSPECLVPLEPRGQLTLF